MFISIVGMRKIYKPKILIISIVLEPIPQKNMYNEIYNQVVGINVVK